MGSLLVFLQVTRLAYPYTVRGVECKVRSKCHSFNVMQVATIMLTAGLLTLVLGTCPDLINHSLVLRGEAKGLPQFRPAPQELRPSDSLVEPCVQQGFHLLDDFACLSVLLGRIRLK